MSLKLSYIYGGEVAYRAGEELRPRLLTDYELVYMIKGQAHHTTGGRTYTVPPGAMLLGQPGEREHYQWDTTQVTRHAYFHFNLEIHPADWPSPEAWPRIRIAPFPVVIALFRHILQHIYRHADWPATPPTPDLCRLVAALLDAFFEPPGAHETFFERDRPEPVRRVLQWMRQRIDDTPHQSITLAEAAAVAGVTEKHLCRLFSGAVGHSPMKTGALLRQQLALVLLVRTNLCIKEIADHCGFENALYFSRCFCKTYGDSPSAIRSRLAAGSPPPDNPLPVDVTPRLHW